MEKLQIEYKQLTEITPYKKNPRKNENAVEFVANSIKNFGFKVPIIIDEKGVIVAGHTRYLAAEKLGLESVPTISAEDLSQEQIKAFRIADNKTAEKASWDTAILKDELKDILDDFDMTEFGFGDFELTILTEDFEPEPYDNEIIEEYSRNEEVFLEKKRIIITYRQEQEQEVLELLKLDELKKVVYDISEIGA